MDFVLKLFAFILIINVAQSRETMRDLKSFKLNKNTIYDCVNIYKQPSLSHPLLKNHKIQLEPSFSISKPKKQIKTGGERKKIIECPSGTVPILRNTKEYVANAQNWTEKHFNPFTIESHGTHQGVEAAEKPEIVGRITRSRAKEMAKEAHSLIADGSFDLPRIQIFNISTMKTSPALNRVLVLGRSYRIINFENLEIAGVRSQGQGPYHGLAAWISIHNLNISKDQASYASIYVGSGVNNKVNFIQAGWMVNPKLFGDGRTWSYGYWKGANGAGCYNTICRGFVQVSKTDVLSGPLPYDPKGELGLYYSIAQDKESGNWWIADVNYTEADERIGYWPKELFDLISNSVDMIGVGGIVQASPSGVSPPMGNGHLPTEDDNASARVRKLEILDSNFEIQESGKYKLEKLLDNDKCYGLKGGNKPILFTYGGPGGASCGI